MKSIAFSKAGRLSVSAIEMFKHVITGSTPIPCAIIETVFLDYVL